MMRSMYSHRHSGRITHLHPHPASDIDAGPAVRVWPGRVGDSLPDNIWAQLLDGDGALRGALNVGTAIRGDSPRPPCGDGRWRDTSHARYGAGATKVIDWAHAYTLVCH